MGKGSERVHREGGNFVGAGMNSPYPRYYCGDAWYWLAVSVDDRTYNSDQDPNIYSDQKALMVA